MHPSPCSSTVYCSLTQIRLFSIVPRVCSGLNEHICQPSNSFVISLSPVFPVTLSFHHYVVCHILSSNHTAVPDHSYLPLLYFRYTLHSKHICYWPVSLVILPICHGTLPIPYTSPYDHSHPDTITSFYDSVKSPMISELQHRLCTGIIY